jgi:gluconate 2-dehydrogenase alpha chain
MTFRNKVSETALPIRSWGSFMPPNGVGGGGVHWNAETWRFLPSDFQMKTRVTERYGEKFLPSDMTIQDWGVSYDELEPHYDNVWLATIAYNCLFLIHKQSHFIHASYGCHFRGVL